jgi:RimJ/RimL family protein N-acetyltransferase
MKTDFMKKALLTHRLSLIPLEAKDCDKLLSILHNSTIKKFLCDNKDVEREFVENMILKSESLFEEKGIGLWFIKHLTNESILGFCGLIDNEVLELIYVIQPDFQNNGFATESVLKVIDYFRQLRLQDDVFAKIDLPNTESHVVANKIGMMEIGIEKNKVTGGVMKVYKLVLNTK